MNLNQKAAKGNRAEELLSNEIYKEAISNLRDAIIKKWQECPVNDRDRAHELKLMIALIDGLESNIRSFIVDGKAAKFELERLRKEEERKKRFKIF